MTHFIMGSLFDGISGFPRRNSANQRLLCRYTSTSGREMEICWVHHGRGVEHCLAPTRCAILGSPPSVAVESSLSQILEDNPHPKYYLSAKACRGILRRAERRGKELPPMLKEALERQSDSHTRQVTGGNQIPLVMYQHKYGDYREGVGTLKENCGQPSNSSGNIACGAKTYQKVSGCLSPGAHPGSYNGQDAHNDMLISNQYAVRRLTPLECDRLMGYPDNWTLIPGASDTARYKADGNSVAIPCVEYVLEGIAEILRQ